MFQNSFKLSPSGVSKNSNAIIHKKEVLGALSVLFWWIGLVSCGYGNYPWPKQG